jgi:hypothetical protein
LLWFFWRWGLANNLPRLASNYDPILASQAARITAERHRCLAWHAIFIPHLLIKFSICFYFWNFSSIYPFFFFFFPQFYLKSSSHLFLPPGSTLIF